MKINASWHNAHLMPVRPPALERSDSGQKNPTLDQRIGWHIEHAKYCACRPIPPKLRKEIEKRKSKLAC